MPVYVTVIVRASATRDQQLDFEGVSFRIERRPCRLDRGIDNRRDVGHFGAQFEVPRVMREISSRSSNRSAMCCTCRVITSWLHRFCASLAPSAFEISAAWR